MKIAIIGAGPGGLYAALAAADNGCRVDLMDRGRVGDRIICGECIFDSLAILSRPRTGLLHPVEDIVLEARGLYRLAVGRYRKLWMMDRAAWQQDLARQAVARGVTLLEHRKVTPEEMKSLQKRYDWIIDGSGAPSVSSRLYGFSRDYAPRALVACQVVLAGNFSGLLPAIKAAFLPDIPKESMPAYYWIFPKDRNQANVGIVCTARPDGRTGLNLKSLLEKVIQKEGLCGETVLKRGGGLIPNRILPRLVYDNIILVGDAAGLASPLHGGGIDAACLSGVFAVKALLQGQEGVWDYRRRLISALREKTALENLIVRKLRSRRFDFNDLDGLLQAAAIPSAAIRAKATLRHPDLLYAAWNWLKQKRPPVLPENPD